MHILPNLRLLQLHEGSHNVQRCTVSCVEVMLHFLQPSGVQHRIELWKEVASVTSIPQLGKLSYMVGS